jgi:ABC-type amino acid transport substrate-binding protein
MGLWMQRPCLSHPGRRGAGRTADLTSPNVDLLSYCPKAPDGIRTLPLDKSPIPPGATAAEALSNTVALTIATTPFELPLDAYANDTKTAIGNKPDIAQLIADSLGLKLELVPVAWPDWPLGLASGKFDAVISNVTVTEARKEKFDFSTYRHDVLGFYVKADNKTIESIVEPKDVAGLKVIVSSGTNQEQILLNWAKQNKDAGLEPTEIQYYDDSAVRRLALESGRLPRKLRWRRRRAAVLPMRSPSL